MVISFHNERGVFRFLRRLAGMDAREQTGCIDGLLSSPEFALALAKERARVDRGGPGFCMLALEIEAAPESAAFREAAEHLAALLRKRTRLIDTKGWFGERVAVIFPQTAANRVAIIWPPIKEALDRALESGDRVHLAAPAVRCEVYAYPCDGEGKALNGNE